MVSDALFEFGPMTGDTITATAASEDILDLGSAEAREIGTGEPVRVKFVVTATFDSAGDAGILTVHIVKDSVAPVDASSTKLVSSAAIPQATLVDGYEFELTIPAGVALDNILGIYYVVTGADFTAGKLAAFITK